MVILYFYLEGYADLNYNIERKEFASWKTMQKVRSNYSVKRDPCSTDCQSVYTREPQYTKNTGWQPVLRHQLWL